MYGADAKHTTLKRSAANEAEKKVLCGTCSNDSWIFAHKWTTGLTYRFCCHPFSKPAARASLLVREQQWMREPPQQEVSNHGYDNFFKKKLDAAERAGDEGAVKKIRALCPDLVSNSGGDEGVRLADLAHETDAEAAATTDATGRGIGTTQAQGSRARRDSDGNWEVHFPTTHALREHSERVGGQSASWTRRPRRRTKSPSNWNVLQPSEWEQSRRQRVPMEEDTKTPTSMEEDDEVKQLLVKGSKEAEKRADLARPGGEPKEPKPEDKG